MILLALVYLTLPNTGFNENGGEILAPIIDYHSAYIRLVDCSREWWKNGLYKTLLSTQTVLRHAFEILKIPTFLHEFRKDSRSGTYVENLTYACFLRRLGTWTTASLTYSPVTMTICKVGQNAHLIVYTAEWRLLYPQGIAADVLRTVVWS